MRIVLLACATLSILACSKPQEPEPAVETKPTAAASSPAPKNTAPPATSASPSPSKGPGDLAYDVPAAWKSAPNPSTMRKATFIVPRAAGDTSDGELAVSSAMGGVDANVGRWAGQFGNATPKTEKRTVNGLAVTIVEIKGPYAGMGQPAPTPNQMLLGAIVDGGDQQHFFKLVGPEKTVTAARKDFDAFVASLRAK
jgi:hypothetical protein